MYTHTDLSTVDCHITLQCKEDVKLSYYEMHNKVLSGIQQCVLHEHRPCVIVDENPWGKFRLYYTSMTLLLYQIFMFCLYLSTYILVIVVMTYSSPQNLTVVRPL